jgi:hypothetical protein
MIFYTYSNITNSTHVVNDISSCLHEITPPVSLKIKPTFPPLPLSQTIEGEGRKRPEKISLKGSPYEKRCKQHDNMDTCWRGAL